MAYTLFLDESGELGFSEGSSKFFLITVLNTDEPKKMKNRLRKQKTKLHDAGWPVDLEIKGTTLFSSPGNPRVPRSISDRKDEWLDQIIERVLDGAVSVHYSIVNKSRMSEHLRRAPYGIAYNYFAGKLLTRAYAEHFAGPLVLIADQRSKEQHDKMTFGMYVRTQLIAECEHIGMFEVRHEESHDILGLQAVDIISWGLFRYFEHNDRRYKTIIDPSVGYCDRWYPGK